MEIESTYEKFLSTLKNKIKMGPTQQTSRYQACGCECVDHAKDCSRTLFGILRAKPFETRFGVNSESTTQKWLNDKKKKKKIVCAKESNLKKMISKQAQI
jgi:hypothetical protein